VLDVLTSITHDVIGDRAFSENPEIVARLGLSVCRTLLAAGVTPVIKHLPGHGRGSVDSHKDLPRVSEPHAELDQTDFAPFRSLAKSEIGPALWGMVAHIVYEAIDPDQPSSVSEVIIRDIIRKQIGFDGLLLSDDLDMEALGACGDAAERAKFCLAAGCDVALYCGGDLAVMQKIAKSVPKISAEALKRLQKAADFPKIAA
jgi:beta-N-acetylhexosaminidase